MYVYVYTHTYLLIYIFSKINFMNFPDDSSGTKEKQANKSFYTKNE